jgi:hypothetical protein
MMSHGRNTRDPYGLWRIFTLRNAEQTDYYESSATCQEDESISLYNFFNDFLGSICKTPTEIRWSYEILHSRQLQCLQNRQGQAWYSCRWLRTNTTPWIRIQELPIVNKIDTALVVIICKRDHRAGFIKLICTSLMRNGYAQLMSWHHAQFLLDYRQLKSAISEPFLFNVYSSKQCQFLFWSSLVIIIMNQIMYYLKIDRGPNWQRSRHPKLACVWRRHR